VNECDLRAKADKQANDRNVNHAIANAIVDHNDDDDGPRTFEHPTYEWAYNQAKNKHLQQKPIDTQATGCSH
jgi:hypothetical protein